MVTSMMKLSLKSALPSFLFLAFSCLSVHTSLFAKEREIKFFGNCITKLPSTPAVFATLLPNGALSDKPIQPKNEEEKQPRIQVYSYQAPSKSSESVRSVVERSAGLLSTTSRTKRGYLFYLGEKEFAIDLSTPEENRILFLNGTPIHSFKQPVATMFKIADETTCTTTPLNPRTHIDQCPRVTVSEEQSEKSVTYRYRVENTCKDKSVSFYRLQVGGGVTGNDESGVELASAPVDWTFENRHPNKGIKSPPGWNVECFSQEESSNVAINWDILDSNAPVIAPGKSLEGFEVVVEKADRSYSTSHWVINLPSAYSVSGTLER